jgi:hypothetical protein
MRDTADTAPLVPDDAVDNALPPQAEKRSLGAVDKDAVFHVARCCAC